MILSKKIEAMPGELIKVIEEEMLALATHLAGVIQSKAPIATGALSGSVSGMGEAITGGGVEMQIGSPLWGSYGAYVELGTRPHWMPIEPLVTWVREKGLDIITKYIKTGRMRRSRGEKAVDEIRKIARAIQWKIAKEGTRAQQYVEASLTEMAIPHSLTTGPDGLYYTLDISSYLNSRGIWAKTAERVKRF